MPQGVGLKLLAEFMHGPPTQVQFTREASRGFTFANAAEQQDYLCGSQVFCLKHRPTIEGVNALTLLTPIDRHLTASGLAKRPRPIYLGPTPRTFQSFRMEMFHQPTLTYVVIQQINYWK
ncbi:MAG: hypothetical protein LC742_03510, partial [Acidobacteria bacterium]|nr:hypothetical protein [Acidobacteriota bacterium]